MPFKQDILMINGDSEAIETAFAQLSGEAFSSALDRALQAGNSVLLSEGNSLYRIYPDGRKEFVKSIDAPIAVVPNQQFQL